MKARLTVSLILSATPCFLIACGNPMKTMEVITTDFSAHVSELETEFSTHSGKAAAATSVSGIAELDGTHRTMALGDLAKLDEMIAHMAMCQNEAKAAPDLSACKEAMAKLRSAVDSHPNVMAAKTGLTEARVEEERHHADVGAQLTVMKAQSTSLTTLAPKFMCPEAKMGH